MKKFTIIFFLVFFEIVFSVNIIFSQENQAYLDSLLKELETAKEDTNKVNVLGLFCSEYLYSTINNEKAIYYSKKALALAEKLNYQAGIAVNYFNLGSAYSTQGNDAQSLDHYLIALKIYEELNDNNMIGGCLNNIGYLYDNQGQYDEALKYYFKTIEIYEMLDDQQEKEGKVLGFNNIGLIYSHKGDFQLAIEYLFKSLDLARELDDKNNISNCLNSIGEVHIKFEKYPEALDYLSKALDYAEEINDKESIATNFLDIGSVYLKQGSYNLAIAYLERSLKLFRELDFRYFIKKVYHNLSQAYELLNDKSNALEYYKLYIAMKDSLLNSEVIKKMSEMSTRHEIETKEKEIELLNKDKALQAAEMKKQKTVRNSFIAGFALLLVFAFILYTRFRLIRKQKCRKRNNQTEEQHH
ncbi:MAG: tetratricopeptide repeat protein [Bacteroidota bacterium]